MKLSAAIRRATDLATTIREYWDRELPKRHKDYPWIRTGEDSGPPPPESEELRLFLNSLPSEDVYRVMAVMYLGRGDMNALGVYTLPDDLKKNFPTRERAVEHMIAKGPLAEYLTDGLQELEQAKIDVDALHLAPA